MDDVVDDVDGYVSVTEIECRERTEHVWVSSARFNLAGDLISQPRSNLDVYSAHLTLTKHAKPHCAQPSRLILISRKSSSEFGMDRPRGSKMYRERGGRCALDCCPNCLIRQEGGVSTGPNMRRR